MTLQPNQGIYWDTLGWAHYKNGQLEEAVTAQERAAKLDPTHPETRYHLGVIYEAQGRREAARDEYRAALQRDPRFAPARAALIRLGSPPTPLPAGPTPPVSGGK